MQSRALIITNYFMLLVFLLCMVVQYNDPDSLIWMTMYGLAAITCVLSIRDKIHFSISIFIGFVGIVWALTLLPDVISSYSTTDNLFTWKMNDLGVEKVREIGGLFIIILWMSILTLSNYLNQK
jgi:hypothetical protein